MMRVERHYGLDWLRIAAFALLIFYHIAMVFAPWHWVIKAPHSYLALALPMALLTPWRLPLLFAVSGYASRKLFDRSGSAGAFARSRALRLLVPLAFGMAAIVPAEMWVRVMEQGYPFGYFHFWTIDYVRWGYFYGYQFPSWEHLWFVAYLASYTFVLMAAIGWRSRGVFAWLEQASAWLESGHRLLWAPLALMAVLRLSLMFIVPDEQGITTGWLGHTEYGPIFLFGFTLGGAPQLWPAIHRCWPRARALVAVTGVGVIATEIAYPGQAIPPHYIMALDRVTRIAMAWAMILALLHIAETWWNRDHRWRKPLAEAVFPAYIFHQPAIVLIAWYTLPLKLPPSAEFAVLLGGTAATCAIAYLAGGRIGWLRPLIGLAPLAPPARSARELAPGPGVP